MQRQLHKLILILVGLYVCTFQSVRRQIGRLSRVVVVPVPVELEVGRVESPALDDGPVEEPLAGRGEQVRVHGHAARALAEEGHPAGVAPEGRHVVPDPEQRLALVPQTLGGEARRPSKLFFFRSRLRSLYGLLSVYVRRCHTVTLHTVFFALRKPRSCRTRTLRHRGWTVCYKNSPYNLGKLALIGKPDGRTSLVSAGAVRSQGEEPHWPQPVLYQHQHHVPVHEEVRPVREVVGVADGEAAAVEPHQDLGGGFKEVMQVELSFKLPLRIIGILLCTLSNCI